MESKDRRIVESLEESIEQRERAFKRQDRAIEKHKKLEKKINSKIKKLEKDRKANAKKIEELELELINIKVDIKQCEGRKNSLEIELKIMKSDLENFKKEIKYKNKPIPNPAILAGTANINTVESNGAVPPGIYKPTFSIGRFSCQHSTPFIVS